MDNLSIGAQIDFNFYLKISICIIPNHIETISGAEAFVLIATIKSETRYDPVDNALIIMSWFVQSSL